MKRLWERTDEIEVTFEGEKYSVEFKYGNDFADGNEVEFGWVEIKKIWQERGEEWVEVIEWSASLEEALIAAAQAVVDAKMEDE